MYRRISAFCVAALALGACQETTNPSEPGVLRTLPEGVAEMAAPNQDLASVRILPEDGCLWYRHDGPVESTLLPLRDQRGRPLCTRPAAEAEAS